MIDLTKVITIVNDGGIVVFPTDTAFGVGCRMDNAEAIKKLFKIRKRPESQATPVLVSSIEMAQKYLQPIPSDVKKLMEKFWPGALTIILPCKIELVSELVRGGTTNLGVRMPNHKIPLAIINSIDVPILGPSANFHGEPTPYKFCGLDKNFLNLVDFVISGKCKVGLASTVLDCTQKPYKIIRQGSVKI